MLLAVFETTVYVDFVLLCGGPSLREGQRPEFDTWLDNLFGRKDGLQGRFWYSALRRKSTISS
jgi:hypothetical protein